MSCKSDKPTDALTFVTNDEYETIATAERTAEIAILRLVLQV